MFRRPPQQNSQHDERVDRPLRLLRPALAAVVVACVGLLLVATSCSGGGDDAADAPASSSTSFTLPPLNPEDIPTVSVPEGFVLVDARGVALQPFESKPKGTTPPLPVLGGGAIIAGRVSGPDGPVGGASVLLERIVGDRTGSITVATKADGSYEAKGIHGGKYRVRAWVAPTLATGASTLVYLADLDGRATVDLALEVFTGRSLQMDLDITALNVGDTAHVRALLTDRVVNDEGIVIGQAIASAEVTLSGSGSMEYGEPKATTNGEGMASWEVTCTREGSTTFTATAEGATDSFTSPGCGPKPTTTTTAGTVEVPDFPVGEEFDVPHKGVLPAGTYVTFLNNCKTSYEVYTKGAWQTERVTASGSTMTLAGPAREFRAADDSKGCSYRRQS